MNSSCQEYLLPFSVDMRITSKCNLQCPFCFGTSCSKDSNIEELCSLVDRFWLLGVKVIVFTGGEPTLYPNIHRLLSYSQKKGFKIVLSTNGTTNEIMNLFQCIDALSLPIDGEDFPTCKGMRGINYSQYLKVLNTMKIFKETYPKKVLKIGTVVTQKNMYKISGILNLIKDYADVWKLYQVSEHPKNRQIYDSIKVPDSQFDKICSHIRELCGNSIQLETYRNSNRNGKYLFCEPNLDAVIISESHEATIGNFKSGLQNVLFEWKTYVNKSLLEENVRKTYQFSVY